MFGAALQASSLLTILLLFKFSRSNAHLGSAKVTAGRRPAEDFYQAKEDAVTAAALEALDRAQRIVNNDLENIPFGLIMMWASCVCIWFTVGSAQKSHSIGHIILATFFTFARFLHTYTYLHKQSGRRTLAWSLGVLCTFCMGINAIVAAFRIPPQEML